VADFDAQATSHTKTSVYEMLSVRDKVTIMRADNNTAAAIYASLRKILKLRLKRYRFGIMAPAAAVAAALHENRSPYTWTVM
jgi:hypothetical protein